MKKLFNQIMDWFPSPKKGNDCVVIVSSDKTVVRLLQYDDVIEADDGQYTKEWDPSKHQMDLGVILSCRACSHHVGKKLQDIQPHGNNYYRIVT